MSHRPTAAAIGIGMAAFSAIPLIINVYVPPRLAEAGASASVIGFALGWDNWLALLITPLIAVFSDRIAQRSGRWPLIALTTLFVIGAFLILGASAGIPAILAALFVTNLAVSSLRVPINAMIGDRIPAADQISANGLLTLVSGIAVIPIVLATSALPDAAFWIGAAGLAVACIVLGIAERRSTAVGTATHDDAPIASVWQFVRATPTLYRIMLSAVLLFSATAIVDSWASRLGQELFGIEPATTAGLVALGGIMLIVAALPIAAAARRWGATTTMQTIGVLFALSVLIVPFLSGIAAMSVLMVLTGISATAVFVLALPLILTHLPPARAGIAASIFLLAYNGAYAIAPNLAGVGIDLTGSYYTPIVLIAVLSAAGAMTLWRGSDALVPRFPHPSTTSAAGDYTDAA